MNLFMLAMFVVWIYVVWTCKRADLKFQRFLIGSVGMFVFLIYWLEPIIGKRLEEVVALISGMVGEMTGTYESYYKYAMLFIRHEMESVSIYVSFECSGIIETFAYISLLFFFEVYDLYERTVLMALGVLAIFLANIIRISTICILIYFYGNKVYYIGHSVIGRFIFYILSIML